MFVLRVILLFLTLGCAVAQWHTSVYLYKYDTEGNRRYLVWDSGLKTITIPEDDEITIYNYRPFLVAQMGSGGGTTVAWFTMSVGGSQHFLKWRRYYDEGSMQEAYESDEPFEATVILEKGQMWGYSGDLEYNAQWRIDQNSSSTELNRRWLIRIDGMMFNQAVVNGPSAVDITLFNDNAVKAYDVLNTDPSLWWYASGTHLPHCCGKANVFTIFSFS
jgi:hypothetical protein